MTDREVINMLIDAWETINGMGMPDTVAGVVGARYSPHVIEDWLIKEMGPAINKARACIGRKKPEIRKQKR